MRGPEILKAKIRKPTPNKLCLLKQIVNVNKDISFHNKENETSYMLLFILFISVLGARRNCDATGKTPIVDIFLTVWLGIFRTSALKWREAPRCGSMESVYLPRKNIQDSENTTHDLTQLYSFLQFVIWPHEVMVNPARAPRCTAIFISKPWRIDIGKSWLILYLDIINHNLLKNENGF